MANLKQVLFGAVALTVFSTPLLAKADDVGSTLNCMETINGSKVQAIAVYNGPFNYKTRLIVDGKELTALGCVTSSRPSTKYVRCSFKSGDYRFEIYPLALTTGGKRMSMKYVIWSGRSSVAGSFNSCAN